jgi:FixJ family two-component response regulator
MLREISIRPKAIVYVVDAEHAVRNALLRWLETLSVRVGGFKDAD